MALPQPSSLSLSLSLSTRPMPMVVVANVRFCVEVVVGSGHGPWIRVRSWGRFCGCKDGEKDEKEDGLG